MNAKRWLLTAAAAEILIAGSIYFFAPAFMMAMNGMAVDSVDMAHTIRAGYGGLFVAFGLLFAAGALRPAMTENALWALAAFMSGFAVGRIASIVVDGKPNGVFFVILATEIVFAAASIHLLSRSRKTPPA